MKALYIALLISFFILPAFVNALVNGTTVESSEFAAIRSFYVKNSETGYVSQCSGTFISGRHLLTAAHCLFEGGLRPDIMGTLGIAPYPFHLIRVLESPSGVGKYKSFVAYIHPDYVYDRSRPGPDVAIIEFNSSMTSTLLPVSQRPISESEAFDLAGYGCYKDRRAPVKKLAVGYNRSMKTLNQNYAELNPGNTHFCKGDSGGPLLRAAPQGYEIVGVMAYMTVSGAEFSTRLDQGTQTRVYDWIQNVLAGRIQGELYSNPKQKKRVAVKPDSVKS